MKTLYFLNRGELLSESMTVPIKPKQSNWYREVNPTRMIRSFEFDSYEKLMFFVSQTMRFASKIGHHPNITINYCKVTLSLEYGFSSAALASVVGPVFDKIAASLVDAFVKRAEQIYGTESA